MSSTRSVLMVSVSFIPTAYQNVGNSALLLACLYLTCSIGRSCNNGIIAREVRLPLPGPQNPGILREWRAQFRGIPGYTAINTYLYFLNSTITSKGYTTDFNAVIEWNMTGRTVNARDSVQGTIIPALVSI